MARFILYLFILLVSCTNSQNKENTASTSNTIMVLEPSEFKTKFSATPDAILIDVRKPQELPDGIISGASNIDFTASDFAEKIAALDKNKPYFVYCKSGKRSSDAVVQMQEMGFKNLYTLHSGLNNWKDQGLEIVKAD